MEPVDNRDIRPRPDPTVLTTAQLDREIAHLKELMVKDQVSQQKALEVALTQMDRRLGELNELRKAVETDRLQFVRVDVYHPAHEELRRQRVVDGERLVSMAADVKTNATDLAELKSSMMWLSRLVVGALISAIILYAFQKLTGR
jgi:multidrug efflux pump subunit AcrA (membrane-fusion protein)